MEFVINEDFTSEKDQMRFPLKGEGILVRGGTQFLVKGPIVIVFPGCTVIDNERNEATLFLIKGKEYDRRKKRGEE